MSVANKLTPYESHTNRSPLYKDRLTKIQTLRPLKPEELMDDNAMSHYSEEMKEIEHLSTSK